MSLQIDTGTDIEPAPLVAPTTLYATNDAAEIVRQATAQANVLADVIHDKRLMANIQGREHVLVEGWTLLGTMVGVYPVCVWTHELENGYEARVEARTMAGQVLGAAESMCTRSERTWSKRDDYALRSMAQTRAVSKALRMPLGAIMSLAGFDPTPAEELTSPEVSGGSSGDQPAAATTAETHQPPAPTSSEAVATASSAKDGGGSEAPASGPPAALTLPEAKRALLALHDGSVDKALQAIEADVPWSKLERKDIPDSALVSA